IQTSAMIDLTVPPLNRDRTAWIDPVSYEACQSLAETARQAGVEVVRYQSVRDPEGRAGLAVLTCSAFGVPEPMEPRTWRLRLSETGVQAMCEFPRERLEFG